MADDEQKLIEDARQSREETQELREESGLEPETAPANPPPEDGGSEGGESEPWARTSSGDSDSGIDEG
jgi:hypothetical protein